MDNLNSQDNKIQYRVISEEKDIGLRVDQFLSCKIPVLNRNNIKDFISNDLVYVLEVSEKDYSQAKLVKKSSQKIISQDQLYFIVQNDCNSMSIVKYKDSFTEQKNIHYNFFKMIVFEDDDLIIINKPAGLLSQKKPGHLNKEDITVSDLMQEYLLSKGVSLEYLDNEIDWQDRRFIVHRLDRETSGLMLLAKNKNIFNLLKNLFAERSIRKFYLGLVWGVPSPRVHTLTHWMRRDNINRTKMLICTNTKIIHKFCNNKHSDSDAVRDFNLKQATTSYQVKDIFFNGSMSLLDFEIFTGRTHQIRAQMEFFKHPIVLDKLYFGGQSKMHILQNNLKNDLQNFNKLKNILNLVNRHLLHAYRLNFVHPISNQEIDITIDLPEDFKYFINN